MPRLRYATPEDVLRRATGSLYGREDLDTNRVLQTADDRETFTAWLEGAEARWDREATPMRAVAVGSRDVPKYFSAKGKGFPVHVYLDHRNVHPIDPDLGDFIERRTGRDSWVDITSREGSAWVAEYDMGRLTIYRRPGAGALPALRRHRDRFIRMSYHISAGGDFMRAGETTLAEGIDPDAETTVAVAHADHLPREGGLMLVGGTEYVHVAGADHDANEVTIAQRGRRDTESVAHDQGATIHFCPEDVRDAVAALGAIELARTEDFTEAMFDGDTDRSDKISDWEDEWNRAVGSYSDKAGYS